MLTRVSEMDTGGDAATPGPPNATSAMSADDAWDLKQGELQPWAHNREAILADIKRKLENTKHSPVSYLETKYSSVADKEQYARALWQELPPMDSNPPLMEGDLPGKPVGSLTAQDVCVVHLAAISFSGASMVCEPTVDKCLKLADEILTDGFVTDTEPLLLNVSPTQMENQGLLGIPPWGEMVNGKPSLRPFSVCHHKSAARVIALHILVNVFMEEPQLLVWPRHDT